MGNKTQGLVFQKDVFIFSLGVGLVWFLAPLILPSFLGLCLSIGSLIGILSFIWYSKVFKNRSRISCVLTVFLTLIPFDLAGVLANGQISLFAIIHFLGNILIAIVLYSVLKPFSSKQVGL